MTLPRELTRRRFLGLCAGASVSALLAACISESTDPQVDEVVISPDEIPEPGEDPLHSEPGRVFLIHNEEGLLAISAKCTHQGCLVGWRENEDGFHCPCHNSRFDRRGVEYAGPAPRPLDLMHIERRESGELVILTGEITTREDWDPSQSLQI